MKNLIYCFLIIPLFGLSQNITFSDEKFKTVLIQSNAINNFVGFDLDGKIVAIDQNGDDEISIEEAENISVLLLSQHELVNIKGIEYFTNLIKLDCSTNNISELDISQNTNLRELICGKNGIRNLDLSNNPLLIKIHCSYNPLIQLEVNHLTELTNIQCIASNLKTLNLSNNTKMTFLDCSNNILTELNLTNNPLLKSLSCNSNHLTQIDLTSNVLLDSFTINNNQLSSLNLANNSKLTSWFCENNKLETLYIKNNTIYNFWSGFAGNPMLKHICMDDNEKEYIEGKAIEYGYSDIDINTECEYNLSINPYPIKNTSITFNNPVTQSLIIDSYGERVESISIYSIDGKLIIRTKDVQINTSSLQKGTYFLHINTNKGLSSEQFIKL